MTKRRRKRLTRKNNAEVQTLDISFQPTDNGCDVVATYQSGKKITTRFDKQLDFEDQEQIRDAFFLGYTMKQFKVDCPELAESCKGWRRGKEKRGE